MKKVLIIGLIILLGFLSYCFCHSGNTDSKGGHYNRKTGKYHYHHGSSAHSHPHGVCSNSIMLYIIGLGILWLVVKPKNKKDN